MRQFPGDPNWMHKALSALEQAKGFNNRVSRDMQGRVGGVLGTCKVYVLDSENGGESNQTES